MKPIFGAMNIGQQVFGDDAVRMLERFGAAGGVEIDAAYVYNNGACEEILGECLNKFGKNRFRISTKANPRVTGRLDYRSVKDQLDGSLRRLGLERVDVFYLHFPDASTPVEEAIRACSELYSEGKFAELGVSNFPLSLIEEMVPVCDRLSCPRPTVFEGVYNALSRKAEAELIPALDRLGMRFNAYNPLAGGLLTGKYHDIREEPTEGRFALRAKSYQGRYWKKSYFDALGIVSDACEAAGVADAEAALRWLAFHSSLDGGRGDGVILGASKLHQLEQNLVSFEKGPLPGGVVDAFDRAWALTKEDSPEYYRFYSAGKAVG